MADPLCQKLYGYHQQQGGQLPYPNFAYLCWATRYFTPDGIAYFQQTEQENWKKEHLAAIDLRQMEAIRGQAQNDLNRHDPEQQRRARRGDCREEPTSTPRSAPRSSCRTLPSPTSRYWDPASQAYYTMDDDRPGPEWHNNAWQTIQRQPTPAAASPSHHQGLTYISDQTV